MKLSVNKMGGKVETPKTFSRGKGESKKLYMTNAVICNKKKTTTIHGGMLYEAPAMRTGVRLGELMPYLTLPYW